MQRYRGSYLPHTKTESTMRTKCTSVQLERFFNIINALIFIGALVYFIATVSPELVPLGHGQAFCKCTPATASKLNSVYQTVTCLPSVFPSTKEQVSSQYYNDYYVVNNKFEGIITEPALAPCVVSDAPTVTIGVASVSKFPTSDMTFDCATVINPTTGAISFFANITSGPVILTSNGVDIKLHQIYYFKSSAGGYEVALAGYSYLDLHTFHQLGGECVQFLDVRDWQSHCICPLNVIGNAVSIASIAVLAIFPIQLYRNAMREREKGDALRVGEV